jgi:hypothetical protein
MKKKNSDYVRPGIGIVKKVRIKIGVPTRFQKRYFPCVQNLCSKKNWSRYQTSQQMATS